MPPVRVNICYILTYITKNRRLYIERIVVIANLKSFKAVQKGSIDKN